MRRADGVGPDRRARGRRRARAAVVRARAREDVGVRGTLHLLVAGELARLVAGLSRLRPRYDRAPWLRAHGLERARPRPWWPRSRPPCVTPLTRDELADRVATATGHGLSERLRAASATCSSRSRSPAGSASPRATARASASCDRTPGSAAGSGRAEQAARASSRLPARLRACYARQLPRWFGMTSPAEAGRWLAALGEEVVEVDVGTAARWMLAADVAAAAAPGRPASCGCSAASTRTSWRRRATPRRCSRRACASASTAAGLALAGAAGRRRIEGVWATSSGRPAGGRNRAVGRPARASGPARRTRPSAWRRSWAASCRWPGPRARR